MGRKANLNTDWVSVEREYRAGQISLAAIGDMYGVSKGRISQKAKAEGWIRDLAPLIRARAETKLAERLANKELNAEANKASDEERVSAGADVLVQLVEKHQTLIQKLRTRIASFEEELSACGENLSERVRIIKNLTEAAKAAVALERQAFGLSDNANGDADKPKEETSMGDMEAARRIAFTLLKASR